MTPCYSYVIYHITNEYYPKDTFLVNSWGEHPFDSQDAVRFRGEIIIICDTLL